MEVFEETFVWYQEPIVIEPEKNDVLRGHKWLSPVTNRLGYSATRGTRSTRKTG